MWTRRVAVSVVAMLAVALVLTGCAPKKKATSTRSTSSSKAARTTSSTKTPDKTATTDPPSSTTGSSTTADASSQSITSPASGSKERTALLNAARAKLGSGSQLYVYGLYEQGDTALGDLKPLEDRKSVV